MVNGKYQKETAEYLDSLIENITLESFKKFETALIMYKIRRYPVEQKYWDIYKELREHYFEDTRED